VNGDGTATFSGSYTDDVFGQGEWIVNFSGGRDTVPNEPISFRRDLDEEEVIVRYRDGDTFEDLIAAEPSGFEVALAPGTELTAAPQDPPFTGNFALLIGGGGAPGAGLTTAQLARLLPTPPARGERDGKIAEWVNDVLTWVSNTAGLSEGEVDARITALVAQAALAGDNTPWDDAKVASSLARDSEVTAAVAGFLTLAQIQALGYQTAAGVLAVLASGRFLSWGAAYDPSEAYVPGDVVGGLGSNANTNYLNTAATTANTRALTEPGSGSDWASHWIVLGHRVNNPDAFTGVTPGDGNFTLTRAGGQHPVQVDLGESGAVAGHVVAGVKTNLAETGRATGFELLPLATDGYGHSADRPSRIRFDFTDGAGLQKWNIGGFRESASIVGTPLDWASGQNITAGAGRYNDGDLFVALNAHVAAAANEPGTGADWTDHWVRYGLRIPADGMYAIDTGIYFTLRIPPSEQTGGRTEAGAKGQGGASRNTIYTRFRIDRDGTVIPQSVSEGTSYFRGDTELDDVCEHTDWHRLREGDILLLDHAGSRAQPAAQGGNQATTIYAQYQGYKVLGEQSVVSVVGFSIEEDGAFAPTKETIYESAAGANANSAVSLEDGKRFSDYDLILLRMGGGSASRRRSYVFDPNSGAPQDVTQGSTLRIFTKVSDTSFTVSNTGNTGSFGVFEIVGFKLFSTAGGDTPATPTLPSITAFTVTGDQHVPAGTDISGRRYDFATQIAQAAHAGAVRIVGYAGAAAANPSSVTELTSIGAAGFAHATGHVNIPANTTLAAVGDGYNIRLEVYATGKTPGTDAPTAYQDYRITAIAASAQIHFGAILSTEDASDIVFADDDIETRGAVAGTWTASGVSEANETDLYREYLAVPASLPQPTTFTSGGLPASNSWDSAVDRTISGTAYKIYLVNTLFADTGAVVNGRSWGVS